ncbi:hypothetical protein [Thermovibrio sp.]
MRDFAKLIESYYFQIALTITFIVIALTVPLLYYPLSFNLRYEALSFRCFFLDLASSLVFYLVEEGRFRSLLTFSIGGALSSLLSAKFQKTLLLSPCLALTVSSVMMVSLVAYHYLSSDRTSRRRF